MLTIRHDVPNGFLDCEATELHRLFDGPTLIHLSGERETPLFVSIILHGNEVSGLLVIQQLLRRYKQLSLPRALSILVGNVAAAEVGKRFLPGQPDYNRIWTQGRDWEHDMTQQVLTEMEKRKVLAAVDIHNNTGRNPFYPIVATRDPRHLQLARLFSRTVVYSLYPQTTCTVAFSKLCPAVTVEAGLPGDPQGVAKTLDFLEAFLELDDLPAMLPADIDLFHTVAVVKVARTCSCGMLGEDVDVQLFPEIDRYNFQELAPGTQLAKSREGCVEVRPTENADADNIDYFVLCDGELRVAKPIMPAMLTTNPDIIGMDCLCYLMERLSYAEVLEQ